MDITEVIELMSIVDSMDNISEITVTLGETPSVNIKKASSPSLLPPDKGFQSASTFTARPTNNLATPGQVKFALDLATKIGNGNMSTVVNGLAHSLELTVDEILHPDSWAEQMTKEHASLYLDILEAQYKKMQKGAWG
ncbi:MAG: hypothetical protein VW715_04650 [Rhodospirillales bacterium]